MGTVKHILQIKGNAVYTVSPDACVYDALETMEDKNLGSMIVVDDEETCLASLPNGTMPVKSS